MNILMFSRDSTLFSSAGNGFGDSLTRHTYYADLIKKNVSSDSRITIIAYNGGMTELSPIHIDNLTIFPTRFSKKYLFPLDLLIIGFSFLRSQKFDVLISQTLEEDGLIALFLSKVYRTKLITQLHFDIFSNKWLQESRLNSLRKMIAKYVCQNSDSIRVVSSMLGEKLSSYWKVRKPISIVPVAMSIGMPSNESGDGAPNLDRDLESIIGWAQKKRVVLFLGRFCAAKNLDLWLATASLLAELDNNIFFLMCGDGEERGRCIEKAKQLNILDRFFFAGSVDYRNVPSILELADVLLLTSHYEGFGRVVVESFFCGTPVVSTDCGGPSEIIENGKDGYIAPKNDADALCSSVYQLLSDEGLNRIMAQNARNKAVSKYRFEVLAISWVKMWIDVFTDNSEMNIIK